MDTSIRHPNTGHPKWYGLLWDTLAQCEPQLNYLLDFKSFSELAGSFAEYKSDGKTKHSVTPGNFDLGKAHCVLLAIGPERRWTESGEKIRYSGRFVERRHLLLTRNGEILEWRRCAEEKDGTIELVGNYIDEIGITSEVELDGTIGMAEFSEDVAKGALLTLHKLLNEKLERGERHLASRRQVINLINDRIEEALRD